MKKILTSVILAFSITSSYSLELKDATMSVKCADGFDNLVKQLYDGYRESPYQIALNPDKESYYVTFLNKETGTWTLVATDMRLFCVLAEGKGLKPVVYN